MLTTETIQRAPKALLHDHLDGGLRPGTIVDLAREFGYDGLPTTDPDELAAWMRRGADRKSLELYLETFAHTVGVLQERDAIVRVAAECAEDLAADGVVYAEVRYAPELSTEDGLSMDEVVEANLEGFRIGMETLNLFRVTVGAAALGLARRALDEALSYAKSRRLGSGTLADNAVTQAKLAGMALAVDASALLIYRAAWQQDVGGSGASTDNRRAAAMSARWSRCSRLRASTLSWYWRSAASRRPSRA